MNIRRCFMNADAVGGSRLDYLRSAGEKFRTKKTIKDLPTEVMLQILAPLDDFSKQNTVQVNKEWSGLTLGASTIPTKVTLFKFIDTCIESLKKEENSEAALKELYALREKVENYDPKNLKTLKKDYFDVQFKLIEILKNLSPETIEKVKINEIPYSLNHILECADILRSGEFDSMPSLLRESQNPEFLIEFCREQFKESKDIGILYKVTVPYFLSIGKIDEAFREAEKADPSIGSSVAMYYNISKKCLEMKDFFAAYTAFLKICKGCEIYQQVHLRDQALSNLVHALVKSEHYAEAESLVKNLNLDEFKMVDKDKFNVKKVKDKLWAVMAFEATTQKGKESIVDSYVQQISSGKLRKNIRDRIAKERIAS